jgi:hypothetical protein
MKTTFLYLDKPIWRSEMPNPPTHPEEKMQKKGTRRSSHGNHSLSVTPKDVPSHAASSKDIVERKITSLDPDEKAEALLDDAIEMTFPASDPPAAGSTTRIDVPKDKGK